MAINAIERASLAVVTDIVALMERAYRGEVSLKGWTSEADLIDGARTTIDEMTATLLDPNSYTLVGFDCARRVIGCATICFEGVTCSFGKFAVEPILQGGGLGKLLLSEAERIGQSHFGISKMIMTVIEGRSELEAFYMRRGYHQTGNKVFMRDFHFPSDMTRGHNLVLNEFAKDL